MNNKALGAILNIKDERDVHIASFTGTTNHPVKNITDMSLFTHEDQEQLGTCVGQGEGKGVEYDEYKEKKTVTRISKKFIYKQCKIMDNDLNGVQGTSGRTAAKVRVQFGAPRVELVPDNNGVPYADYMAADVSSLAILTDASLRRAKSFAFCLTLDDLKTGIDLEGYINATVMVGNWNNGNPLLPTPADGLHRAFLFGYEDAINPRTDLMDTKIYDFNSWGIEWNDGGNGWFWWSDYDHNVYDMIVYTDMPDTLIDYAKQAQYTFTRILKPGMTGDDIMQLQKRLTTEIGADGLPCYQYKQNGVLFYSTFFGVNTQLAVQRYQTVKGIVSSGLPTTTGYGQMGPTTMKYLNGATVITETKIDLWADAAQEYEGWAPGTRSYKNNNPGNLRYVGQPTAIGKDSANFCIFKTYADGRAALELLFTNACTGKSSIYNPSMSLNHFYETYAPASDSNTPDKYAAFVASKIGISPADQISTLV